MTEPVVLSIKEHEGIYVGQKIGERMLSLDDINQMEKFVLDNQKEENGEIESLLQIVTNGGKKGIKAKNYVGVVMFKNGITLEILPKTASEKDNGRKILLDMLRTLTDSPFKRIGSANLDMDRLPLFEVFIRMFIDRVLILEKHGFRSTYVEHESNEPFCKGKLLVTEQIRHNLIHAERFYVRYDDYNINRPINRLIKATLELLLSKTSCWENKRDIRRLLDVLDEVPASIDYLTDYSKVSIDRGMEEFRPVLSWCMIFLGKKSFTIYAGNSEAISLLFNMNKLFEDYVAAKLRKYIRNLSVQDTRYHLFDSPKMFKLQPDIVINPKSDHPVIFDTKWKLLSTEENNYGISQADMYQMYIYHKKYNARSVTLLYPDPGFELSEIKSTYIAEEPTGTIKIKIEFVKLTRDESEWKSLAERLMKED